MTISEHFKQIQEKKLPNNGKIYWVASELLEMAMMGNEGLYIFKDRIDFEVKQWLKEEGFQLNKSDNTTRNEDYFITF